MRESCCLMPLYLKEELDVRQATSAPCMRTTHAKKAEDRKLMITCSALTSTPLNLSGCFQFGSECKSLGSWNTEACLAATGPSRVWVAGELEPIPADYGRRQEPTLNSSPIHRRAHTPFTHHSLSHSYLWAI
ncbi:hypothetical protein GJAV_G00070820 [Gymnothorax javanicus]|nr:hypothetical protein GJAV_G00070820 [Gymnothorax javanicus]